MWQSLVNCWENLYRNENKLWKGLIHYDHLSFRKVSTRQVSRLLTENQKQGGFFEARRHMWWYLGSPLLSRIKNGGEGMAKEGWSLPSEDKNSFLRRKSSCNNFILCECGWLSPDDRLPQQNTRYAVMTLLIFLLLFVRTLKRVTRRPISKQWRSRGARIFERKLKTSCKLWNCRLPSSFRYENL